MNNKYDPLARYPYTTNDNRQIILDKMNDEEIDYIISQKIKPEQFMPFIHLPNFQAKKILFYDMAEKLRPTDLEYIINFVNTYTKDMDLQEFKNYLTNYNYDQLANFFNGQYPYGKDKKLISDPDKLSTVIDSDETLYDYVPRNLVSVNYNDIPYANWVDATSKIQLKGQALEHMLKMTKGLEKTNHEVDGGLILVSGYLSYQDQIKMYNRLLMKYGAEKVNEYMRVPGCNQEQLGYSVSFSLSSNRKILNSFQYRWLKDHAHEYGFELSYPKRKFDGEKQVVTLRYVGDKQAMESYLKLNSN